jgi:gas vesicle protein
MDNVRAKPVILGTIIGAIVGAIMGVIISTRREKSEDTRLDAKSAAGIGIAAFALAQRIIEAFG